MLKNAPPLLISLIVHVGVLVAMAAVRYSLIEDEPDLVIETVIDDERVQQEFSQELEVDTTTSQSLAVTAGGTPSANIGAASSTAISQTRIETSEIVRDPEIRVASIGNITIPGADELGMDLGEAEVVGETGARVPGYGAAMHRLTLELTRMMRQQPVLAVWLFDASGSLVDDREEIRDNFHKIYEELGIASEQATVEGQRYNALETVVAQFGGTMTELTNGPTSDLEAIRNAIDLVSEDESGEEQTFTSIGTMIERYGRTAGRSDRKLVIIVLTDETGNDEARVEETIAAAQTFSSPVYILGREAIFGYPYTHVRWTDEVTGLDHWVRVDRGPETAMPECLQYDGFHGRWDSASSGFGPYAQVRLVKESGGIYFVLAREEGDLLGAQARMQRNFDDLAMKEYEPLLVPRRDYEMARNQSEFRTTVWDVIVQLNPHLDETLNLRRLYYPIAADEFAEEGQQQFQRAVRSLTLLNQAVQLLERVEPLRATEDEMRWRAAYDLALAQCLAYRVRQFQFLLALDRHVKDQPLPSDIMHNVWNVQHISEMIEPDEQVVAQTRVDLAELEKQRLRAIEMYEYVMQQHPGTPWAQRAAYEKSLGFGISFASAFYDPRYFTPEFQARIPRF